MVNGFPFLLTNMMLMSSSRYDTGETEFGTDARYLFFSYETLTLPFTLLVRGR
jgi:hypothetical protein